MIDPTFKARRRFFRFSLRGLLLMVLVVGVALGLLVHERQRIATRRRGLIDAGFVTLSQLRAQSALRLYLLGDDSPANSNHLAGWRLTNDAGLAHLSGLYQLQTLYLDGAEITNVGMVYLAGLTELRLLDISDTSITDAGLVNIQQMTNLKDLRLNGTQVTDAGLIHLRGLSNLEDLDLRDTHVTDAGVDELQKALPNCHIWR